ncbi:MAG: DegV family protein [Chloroflexota bacterium]|nr:DegV family protein [Chloroflexota bacterium]
MVKTPSIRIVTDTTATLPREFAAAHSIEIVSQIVLFGQESFREEINLSYAEFIRCLKASPQLPKTAAPEPGDLIDAYRRQLAHAQTILSIHPSSDISGTVRSAMTAKEDAFPDADIRILDTRTVGGTLAAMVIAAAEWAENGVTADEIMNRLNALIPRARTYFLVATLENLQKGGRIGGASALIGTALQIKPILELKDGKVAALEKVRTHHAARERLKQLVIEQCPRTPDARLSVMHADDLEAGQRLKSDLQTALGIGEIPLLSVGAAITTHAGPGTLGVGFFA